MSETLAPGQAHLWHVAPERLHDPALLASYDALLTADERARGERFIPLPVRHRHLITRALVRRTLSCYADIPPGAWRFVDNAHGRPEIDPGCGGRGIRFNLSHTDGLIVCLVARDLDIGVDVEDAMRPVDDALAIAARFFSAREAAALAALPAARRPDRFFQYWTLKESYIKARGMGLALPLAAFSFDLDSDPPAIDFEPPIEDDPSAWQFSRGRLGHHALATAIRSRSAVAIHLRDGAPLLAL